MSILNEFTSTQLRQALGNRVLTLPVLAINAAAAATIKTTNAVVFSLDGQTYTRAALAAVALAVNTTLQQKTTYQQGFYVQPVSTTVYYTVVLSTSSGTVNVIQGTYLNQPFQGAGANLGTGEIPDPDDYAFVAIGGIKIVTNSATTFTPGTTALDAAGLTVTYRDYIGMIPAVAW